MPRATQSNTGRVLEYFQVQPLEVASEVLALCVDAVRQRRSKSAKAKQRAAAPQAVEAAPAAVEATAAPKGKPGPKAKAKKPATAGPKKSHKKKPATPAPALEGEQPLPLDDQQPDGSDLGESPMEEYGDGEPEVVGAGAGSGFMPPVGARR